MPRRENDYGKSKHGLQNILDYACCRWCGRRGGHYCLSLFLEPQKFYERNTQSWQADASEKGKARSLHFNAVVAS
jgi:hypothetical protein